MFTRICWPAPMTAKRFYDWQTPGGAGDVMRLVECPERADVAWCAIGGVAVNHWAAHPELWDVLPEGLRQQVQRPRAGS